MHSDLFACFAHLFAVLCGQWIRPFLIVINFTFSDIIFDGIIAHDIWYTITKFSHTPPPLATVLTKGVHSQGRSEGISFWGRGVEANLPSDISGVGEGFRRE